MNKAITLLELIREQYHKKNRPLKIICDWDEVIQPMKPVAIYETYEGGNLSFEEFFHKFWDNAIMEGPAPGYSKVGPENPLSTISGFSGDEEMEKAIEKWKSELKKLRENPKESVYGSREYRRRRDNSPFLSIAKDLVLALKEDLISELILISSYRKGGKYTARGRKQTKFDKTFSIFPQCKLEITGVSKDDRGQYTPFRWQRIKEICPDFDIFIDDSKREISDARKNFLHDNDNKIYVFPDYKCNSRIQFPNIYHIKTTISDLKDEDFAKAAEEYKQKQLAKSAAVATSESSSEREREREQF